MPKEKPTTPNPRNIINGIMRSDEFLGVLQRTDEMNTESGIPRMSRAIGRTAGVLVDHYRKAKQTTYLDTPHQILDLIAHIPEVVEAYAVLDEPSGYYEKQEIKESKLATIRFNHVLRRIIDSSSNLTRRELLALVNQTATTMVPNDQMPSFRTHVAQNVAGMQQEIFTEQALWSIDGVEVYDEVSVDDDKRGVDIRFSYKGSEYALDVKSKAEDAAEAERNLQPGNPQIPFWTGIYGSDLGESFRPSAEQEATIRNRLLALLNVNENAHQEVS